MIPTLTGSEPAGRAVTAAAGAELKPCVLELGGSDPFIVLDDADIDEAAKVGAWARNQNAGQSCIAAKRFIVVDSVYDKFVPKFIEHIKALKVGDPLQRETEVGPMAQPLKAKSLRELEKEGILAALAATGGNKAQAAAILEIDRSTLYKKLKDYDIEG